jgi:protein AroM
VAPDAARPVLGLVTIGQTPRPDFEALFAAHAPGAEIQLAGALDDLAPDAARALERHGGDYPLLVRLRDGSSAEIPLATLVPRVEIFARALTEAGAAAVVVLCAGDFPDIHCGVPVLIPGRILPAVAGALAPRRRVGVVTPVAGQAQAAEAKWRRDGFHTEVVWASPRRHDELAAAAERMAGADVDLIVLDCMGHDDAYRRAFASRAGRPVLAAQTIVARVAGELVAAISVHA